MMHQKITRDRSVLRSELLQEEPIQEPVCESTAQPAQQQQQQRKHSSSHRRRKRQERSDAKLLQRTILRYLISCIIQHRSLAEEANFRSRLVCGLHLPFLDAVDDFGNIISAPGYRITQWLEQGAFEALEKGVLQTFTVLVLTEYNSRDGEPIAEVTHAPSEHCAATTIETFEFRLGTIDENKRHIDLQKPVSDQIKAAFQALMDYLTSTDERQVNHTDTISNSVYRSISFVLGCKDEMPPDFQHEFFVDADDEYPRVTKATNPRYPIYEMSMGESFIGRIISDAQCMEMWYSCDRDPTDTSLLSRLFENSVADLPLTQAPAYDENEYSYKNGASDSRSISKKHDEMLVQRAYQKVGTCQTGARTPKSAVKSWGSEKCPKPHSSSPRRPLPSPLATCEFSQRSGDIKPKNSFSPIPQMRPRFSPFSRTPTENRGKRSRVGRNDSKDISPGEVSEVPTVIVATPLPSSSAMPPTTANSCNTGQPPQPQFEHEHENHKRSKVCYMR